MTTSRGAIIDAIELIINQIALCSHCQELINTYTVDYGITTDDIEKEKLFKKINQQKGILDNALNIRRILSSQLLKDFEGDKNIWCSFKHALASYGYATELWYTDMTNVFYEHLCQETYEQMIGVVSLFLGLDEIVTCGRCLTDSLDDKKNINANIGDNNESIA